jgi:hypothetical protein
MMGFERSYLSVEGGAGVLGTEKGRKEPHHIVVAALARNHRLIRRVIPHSLAHSCLMPTVVPVNGGIKSSRIPVVVSNFVLEL